MSNSIKEYKEYLITVSNQINDLTKMKSEIMEKLSQEENDLAKAKELKPKLLPWEKLRDKINEMIVANAGYGYKLKALFRELNNYLSDKSLDDKIIFYKNLFNQMLKIDNLSFEQKKELLCRITKNWNEYADEDKLDRLFASEIKLVIEHIHRTFEATVRGLLMAPKTRNRSE